MMVAWAISGGGAGCADCTKTEMSSIKDALLGAAADCSDYRTVSKETAIVTAEPPAYKAAGRDHHAYTIDEEGVGAGCVSFHDVSYEVSSYFGRRKKVILNRVR